MASNIRQHFWIIVAKNEIKRVTKHCVDCFQRSQVIFWWEIFLQIHATRLEMASQVPYEDLLRFQEAPSRYLRVVQVLEHLFYREYTEDKLSIDETACQMIKRNIQNFL